MKANRFNALIVIMSLVPSLARAQDQGGMSNKIYGYGFVIGLIAIVALGTWIAGRLRAARLARTPCPNCGRTGLVEEEISILAPTQSQSGKGERRTTCPHCGHVTIKQIVYPAIETYQGGN